jgi:hypothetical protein
MVTVMADAGAPADEITPAMIKAGVEALRLFDGRDDHKLIVWAVYCEMLRAAAVKGVSATTAPEHQAANLGADDRM